MKTRRLRTGLCLAVPLIFALLIGVYSCSDNKTTEPGDTTPPAAITNLAAGTITATSVALTWNAPGDDGSTGTAAQYDIRYSTSAITEANFSSATQVSGALAPAVAGTVQTVTATGLTPATPYYFAIKTADEIPNWSALSNVRLVTTEQTVDTTPPAAVTNLATGSVTATTVALTWTAPGDNGTTGTAHEYDIRYSTAAITEANFASATQVTGVPAPAAAGTTQSVTVMGLTPETPYHFAMKTADEVPNWSALSNVAQTTTAQPPDTAPPAPIADLSAAALDSITVELTWTAPGDDGAAGTAAQYDIRYSAATITEANWGSATQVTGEPAPTVAGSVQEMEIQNLLSDRDYYFAMKTADEVPNASALSNVAHVHTPAPQTGPPGLLAPQFPDSVCITSVDQYAQMAKMMVQFQLSMVTAYSQMATIFFGPLSQAEWQQSGDCWDYEYLPAGCTGVYHACLSGSVYTYTLTLNGSCYGQSYNNWVAYSAVVDQDTRTGTFYMYELNATTIQAAWVWTWAADENAGTYTFYEGDPATAPIQSIIEWSRSADENVYDMTWITPESEKWVSHFVKEPCSGWAQSYQWDNSPPRWWMENDITWNADGTGFWDVYEDTGTLQEHHVW